MLSLILYQNCVNLQLSTDITMIKKNVFTKCVGQWREQHMDAFQVSHILFGKLSLMKLFFIILL